MPLSPSATPVSNGAVATTPARPARLSGLPRRRRPAFAAAGIGLVALGAAVTVSLVSSAGAQIPVLAVARPVRVGAVLSAADLTVARVAHDPALSPLPAGERSRLVGQRAAVALNPGTLLTGADVTTQSVPGSGQQLVAVALKPGQLPAEGLRPGDRVLVVLTPGDGSASAGTGSSSGTSAPVAATPLTAVVHAQSAPAQDGSVVVDLLATGSDGVTIAQESSTGRVTLVQLSAGG